MIRMPVLFIGHGSPMNAIEDNEFSIAWNAEGRTLPLPNAILSISAHWETQGTSVTVMEKPKTIYDFYGFPPDLYAVRYPAPGSPSLAKHIQEMIHSTKIGLDDGWGLDHGSWSVLMRLFPNADIPVIQLSLDVLKSPQQHFQLGRELKSLRDEGVLILGSGNIVHNLRMLNWEKSAFDWAVEFDSKVKSWILRHEYDAIINFRDYGKVADLATNSAEHYKPLLYVMGAIEKDEPVHFFADKVVMGSISMRSLRVG